MPDLIVDFAGERHLLDPVVPFSIGRGGDLRIDDNPYLHRRFLEVRHERGMWWVGNVGSQLAATVSDTASGVHAWLAPGGRMPIVFGRTVLRFTAGPTSYEVELEMDQPPFEWEPPDVDDDGSTTVGRISLTLDQRRMLLALAEAALRRGGPGIVDLPTAANAARRLGWTQKRFERKIDNVCDRLAGRGVRGLKGEAGNLAASRRARLVEYALAARLITVDDLPLLDMASGADAGEADES